MAEPLDELTEALQEVEDALEERKLLVNAEVDLDDEHRLAWVKTGAEWGLVVKKAQETDAWPRTDLVKTSARLRIAAADALPHLYAALAKARDDRDAATRAATEKLRALVVEIRAAGEEGEG